MGRKSTDSVTKDKALSLELTSLIMKGYIKRGQHLANDLHFTNGSKVFIESNLKENEYWLILRYTIIDKAINKQHNYDYKIYLYRQGSNLGKGNILYFICPESGLKTRALYLCQESRMFTNLKALKQKIYYSSQSRSKLRRWNERYWKYDSIINKLESNRRGQYTYNGKPTKHALKIEKLKHLRYEASLKRFLPSAMPLRLRRLVLKSLDGLYAD